MTYTEVDGNVVYHSDGLDITISKEQIFESVKRTLQRNLKELRVELCVSNYNMELDYDYFLAHKNELIYNYKDKYIIIKDRRVVADFETEGEAYQWGNLEYGIGKFLVKGCSPCEAI